MYLRLPDDVRLWVTGDEFEPPRRPVLEAALTTTNRRFPEDIAAEQRCDYDAGGPA